MSGPDVAVVGIGMHPFGRHEGRSGRTQAVHAARAALADAGITFADMQFAFGGSHSAGDADALVSELGLTGLPFVNVSNGCATGGSALTMADRTIRSGAYELGLAIGFDKHARGAFDTDPESIGLGAWYGETGLMLTTQFFAMKIQRYMHEHGITRSTLAKVAAKAFRNGARNPMAWRREPLSEEQILAAPMISHPLTQYMFCSPGEGAVALVLSRADLARRYTDRPVFLRSATLCSRRFGSFEVFSPWLATERAESPSVEAARMAFEQAGIEPGSVDVAQVQDTESGAEIIHMAETGLCKHGEQEALIHAGATEIDGALPVNTDGGCLANGEPIGASGLRQVYESVVQLRGDAGDRQVPRSPRVAFTHVYGAPGVSACTVLTT
jgi:acetyl-CoA C-acetyltransferase